MIPEELKAFNQWVCAERGSKVPMRAFEPAPASCSDPLSWSAYRNAELAVQQGHYDYVGFVFNENGIVGIDIDAGFDEDGLITPLAADIISACNSYTEKSRSGRGFHILVKGWLLFPGRNNRQGVEIYQKGRYFILTGNSLECCPQDIRLNQEGIDYVVQKYFPEMRPLGNEEKKPLGFSRIYSPEWSLPQDGRVHLRPVYPRITPGSRNICLTSLAGMMHSQGYSKDQIYDELVYCNQTACDPCLSKRELKGIANSVTRYKR